MLKFMLFLFVLYSKLHADFEQWQIYLFVLSLKNNFIKTKESSTKSESDFSVMWMPYLRSEISNDESQFTITQKII